MVIDLERERIFCVSDARHHIDHNPQSVRRWILHGRAGSDGKVHRLEAFKNASGRLCTSKEAVLRFTRRLNGMES